MRRPNRRPIYCEADNYLGSTFISATADVSANLGETIFIKAAITVTLPANPPSKGVIYIVNTGNYAATVDGNGNTINGRNTISMRFQYEVNRVLWDGTEWYAT